MREYVIFDVETTGLSPRYGDRIVEIAGLKIRFSEAGLHGELLSPIARFHSLVDPQREISAEAYHVNRITAEMLEGAPTADQVLPDFLHFVGDAALVGHNVRFDISFLIHELGIIGRDYEAPALILDTLKMARTLLPDLMSYSLRNVAYSLAVDRIQEHRAMSDVELTYEVFRHLCSIADRKDIVDIREIYGVEKF